MNDAYNFVIENWDSILLGLTSLVTVASVITKFTKSPKDDAFVAKLLEWVAKIAMNKPNPKK